MSSGPCATDVPTKRRRRYAPRMAPEQRREHLIDAAIEVILERGYAGVSIEAIAREAGITRPVVYDHFPNLNRLLHAVIEREERISLEQLGEVVPENAGDHEPGELLATGVARFLDAVTSRPATWRIILLPLEGTPDDRPRARRGQPGTCARQDRVAGAMGVERAELLRDLDVAVHRAHDSATGASRRLVWC